MLSADSPCLAGPPGRDGRDGKDGKDGKKGTNIYICTYNLFKTTLMLFLIYAIQWKKSKSGLEIKI